MRRLVSSLSFSVVCVLVSIACNPSLALDPGPDLQVGGSSVSGSEPSVTFVPEFHMFDQSGNFIDVKPRTIYQFNGGFVWSWTDDGGSSWHTCNATTPGFPCFVPLDTAHGQTGWNSDPFIAAAPNSPGIVAASLLASNASSGQGLVVVSLSFDGGKSFATTQAANDVGCSSGRMDQPAIAFDPTPATNRLCAVWRYNGAPVNGTYGACVRCGEIDEQNQRINWSRGAAQEVQNLDREPFYGVGGLLVQPFGEFITVVYSNTNNFHKDCASPQQLRWFSVTSDSEGDLTSWTPSHEIFHSYSFAPCTPGNRYIRPNRATFWAQRDSNGVLWAAVNDADDEAQIFFSTNEGTDWHFSQRAVFPGLLFPTLAADASGRVALFFYGATNETGGGLGSTTTPLIMERRANPNLADPTAWTEPQQTGATFASVVLQTCTSDSQCPSVFTGSNNGNCVNNKCVGTRGLGDYAGMTFVPPNIYGDPHERFVPAWTTQSTQIHTSYVDVLQ